VSERSLGHTPPGWGWVSADCHSPTAEVENVDLCGEPLTVSPRLLRAQRTVAVRAKTGPAGWPRW